MGKIIVKRKKSILGFAIPFKIVVDNVEIGKLKNGQEIEKEVELGEHKVLIKTVEKTTPVDVVLTEEKNNVTITVVTKMGLLAASAKLIGIE